MARTPDDALRAARLLPARVAGQSGLVTASQALAAGQTADAIGWRVRSGRWLRLHRGVYLTSPGRDDWQVHAVAALLAVGRPSALAGTSAAKAWGLAEDSTWRDSGRVTVAVPFERRGCSRPGIDVQRRRDFSHLVHPEAWPHRTTAEHTVLDLARGREPDRAIALLARSCQQRLVTESSLAVALSQRARQTHRRLLEEALGLVGDGAESAAEVRYARDVERAHGLPRASRQSPADGGRRRDNLYEAQSLVVEVDGRLGHAGWEARRRDGRRDLEAAVQGLLTVRVGWIDVALTPCELAADLAAVLDHRGWAGRPRPCRRAGCLVGAVAA